jgi:hypothetical protein
MRRLSVEIVKQRKWMRKNTVLEALQEKIDNIKTRTEMEQATDIQIEQILAGIQDYTREQMELAIDQVRHWRWMGDAEIRLEIKRRDLELEDAIAEREHQRNLELMHEEHRHEKEILELLEELKVINALLLAFSQIRMTQQQAKALAEADLEKMKQLPEIILHTFNALAQINENLVDYKRRFDNLDLDDQEKERLSQLIEESFETLYNLIGKRAFHFGDPSRSDKDNIGGP